MVFLKSMFREKGLVGINHFFITRFSPIEMEMAFINYLSIVMRTKTQLGLWIRTDPSKKPTALSKR